MAVTVHFYRSAISGGTCVCEEFAAEVSAALRVGETDDADTLLTLFTSHLIGRLGGFSERELDLYLRLRSPWKKHRNGHVYRVPDTPTLAYAVQATSYDDRQITLLGVTRRYPRGDPEIWWHDTLAPRMETL